MEPAFAFVAVICAAVATAVVMHFDDAGRRLVALHISSTSANIAPQQPGIRSAPPWNAAELVDNATSQVGRLAGIEACWFEPFPYASSLPRLLPGRLQLPGAVPGMVTAEWHPGGAFEVPVLVRALTIGRLVVVPSAHAGVLALTEPTRDAVLGVAGRLGAALGAHWETAAAAIFDQGLEEE